MPRRSSLSPEILAEVERRRRADEAWKVIAADLRARGISADRSHLWRMLRDRRDVAQRLEGCDARLVDAR